MYVCIYAGAVVTHYVMLHDVRFSKWYIIVRISGHRVQRLYIIFWSDVCNCCLRRA